jgi:threonine/homoserine/homoserine lactone efflux protein
VVGVVIGALVLAGFIALGLLLTSRVANAVPVIVLAAAGAYAAWLVGVMVFGAIRAANGENDGSEARER